MKLVNRNLNITFEGDTAYGVLTKTFDGTLFIKGSYDPNATNPDTLIKKVFSATVTRNIVFIKIAKGSVSVREKVHPHNEFFVHCHDSCLLKICLDIES